MRANKGIGFEICKQLASKGILVVLTARDEQRGLEAAQKLRESGLPELVVNNAGVLGVKLDGEGLRAALNKEGGQVNWFQFTTQPIELAEECLKINYYGAKNVAEALIPLLQLSESPRIVNVSAGLGKLKNVPNAWAKGVLSDAENLTEERVDEVLSEFLKDFKEGSLEAKGWPAMVSAYILSKVAMNAHTRILAKKCPNFCVNCVCPGYVSTDMTFHTGKLAVEEGAEVPVKLALLPDGSPSGRYAVVTGANKGIGFDICRQLASNGIIVALTARDEQKGLEATQKLKDSGFSDSVLFHRVDVADPASIASLADFIKTQFGKLDILVNNAGVAGCLINADALRASGIGKEGDQINYDEIMTETLDLAEECLNINYYGAKRMIITNEWAKGVLSDAENLTEERVEEVLDQYLKDFKEGANKGIGFEICKQLASKGILVVLTARDEQRGLEAAQKLRESGLPELVVNNAGVLGVKLDGEGLRAALNKEGGQVNWFQFTTQPIELAEECLKINYYGAKNVAEALIPLLQLSESPRIVNVSAGLGKLKNVPNEWAKGVLSDAESLTEERVDEVLSELLKDFKEGSLEAKDWPAMVSAYILSKVAMNAHTRILAKKYPNFCVNCVCPGYVSTDMTFHTGKLAVEEGAEVPVKLALLPDGSPSGRFFENKEESPF
ncbi:hypothetical protein Tsubulata_007175 [Turnera subulata]|uniref:Uncharacterized protein n=1 Tax=Turnera subulata TaxID=218843 RepID=A0A9Q0F4N0_9ROSI|nr:hypothetical protein Tsubulata_007175 [Turnera subulata]